MLEKFERYPLTFGPTPIEKLERLTEHLGGRVELFAKREDCNSGKSQVRIDSRKGCLCEKSASQCMARP